MYNKLVITCRHIPKGKARFMPNWRNGRRTRFRNVYPKRMCRFDSYIGHKLASLVQWQNECFVNIKQRFDFL